MNTLFTPTQLGSIALSNRMVMAPMTRSRADDAGMVSPLVAEYYQQRASAGLIITEGIYLSDMSKGYVRIPGLASTEHAQAWREVTHAVHAKNGKIIAQLMHCGRVVHPSFIDGKQPLAPSAIRADAKVWTSAGQEDMVTPKAMSEKDIHEAIAAYVHSARLAMEAGFDGVELHAASGYLPEQFLSSSSNQRDDEYGGSSERRVRFVLDVVQALIAAIGADRVGIKIAPEMGFNDCHDDDPKTTYKILLQKISVLNLAYVHIMRVPHAQHDYLALLRECGIANVLVGGGLNQEEATLLLNDHDVRACVFGSLFIANPDLVQRFQNNAPLNTPDPSTFYSMGKEGYCDYPFLNKL